MVFALGHFHWMTGQVWPELCETVVAGLVALLGCYAMMGADSKGRVGLLQWSRLWCCMVHHSKPAIFCRRTSPACLACPRQAVTNQKFATRMPHAWLVHLFEVAAWGGLGSKKVSTVARPVASSPNQNFDLLDQSLV